ncbi:MAG: arabinan endo,5-alpha-L-arabinosidase [Mucilaginibacter sp.]|nr:arabinan endo,5-alpha-L-arabinosidase [Mucilaginibacter sp.]
MKKILGILLFSIMLISSITQAQELKTGISVHDPVMIKQDSVYYVFCTGRGISMFSSTDMVHWKTEKPVFDTAPKWTIDELPNFRNGEWAPDISYYNGKYYLYYAISAFGKNTSCIGVATNTTLHTDDSAYKWVDHGKVIQSVPTKTNWNAIDPNLIIDKDGTPYLDFGSFWEGIKIVRLTKDGLRVDQPITSLPTIASRKKDQTTKDNMPAVAGNPIDAGGNAIEGPFIFRKGKYFYLFASIDYCCKGPNSTYKMIVGRSKKLQGPYLDAAGTDMKYGGGNIVLAGDANWYGVGHNAVGSFNGGDYLIFHGYDASDRGRSKLIIEKINWKKKWPSVAMPPPAKELYSSF